MFIIEKKEYSTNYLRAIEWFEEYLSDVVLMTELIEEYPNDLYYWHKKDGIVLLYDIKNKFFYIKYDKIWRVFQSNFGLNDIEINKLIANILEQHTKRKVVTIIAHFTGLLFKLEQHTKRKVVTTSAKFGLVFQKLKQSIKRNVLTTK